MSTLRTVLLCTITILIVLVPLSSAFDAVGVPMDEGSLLIYPELISKGELPYRDFETFYGPANLWALSGAYAFFSANIFVERSVGLAYRILILLALYRIGRRWNNLLATGCALLGGVLLLPCRLPAYAWMGAVMCGLWSILLLESAERAPRAFLAGALAGISLLFRQDLGPALVLSAIPLLLPASGTARRHYVTGFSLALLPLAWLTFAVGPSEILNNLFLFPVLHANPGRHLPIFSAERLVLTLLFLHVTAVITTISIAGLAVFRNRSDMRSRLLLGLGLFGLGLTHQAVQRLDLLHVAFAAFVSVSLLPLSVFVLVRWKTQKESFSLRDAALALAAVVVFVGVLSPELAFYFRNDMTATICGNPAKTVFVRAGNRSFPFSSAQEATFVTRLLRNLEKAASPGERLFVGPADLRRTNYNDTFLYHLLPELRPASYFLEMNPGSANRPHSRLASDVASADWLVLNHLLDFMDEENESAKFGSDLPLRVVNERFQMCGQFGPWQVYRKKPGGSNNKATEASLQNSERLHQVVHDQFAEGVIDGNDKVLAQFYRGENYDRRGDQIWPIATR
jgi:hypothetical protein